MSGPVAEWVLEEPATCRYGLSMNVLRRHCLSHRVAIKPSRRTLHAEMLRLCARIGYSPPPSR